MKEEKNKIGNIETLEKDSLSYTKNSKDLPTTFFKPIEEVQKTQQEILQNYKIEENIIENFFPGALTIILEKNDSIPNIVTSNLSTVRSKNA